jgi:hypothetical protein
MNQLTGALTGYRAIRERILALEADIDDETLADTLEGLTDLPEIIAAVVRSAVADEALADGLKGHIQVLQGRLSRLTARADDRRRIARDAMAEVAIKKIMAPDFTLSLRPGSPALVVIDDGAIPQPYWQPQPPRLDRLRLLNDLKTGNAVPGVQLSNPEPVLSVRVR